LKQTFRHKEKSHEGRQLAYAGRAGKSNSASVIAAAIVDQHNDCPQIFHAFAHFLQAAADLVL
jgi:hypothetical protein